MKHALYNMLAVATDFKMYYQENTCSRIQKKTKNKKQNKTINKHINISVSEENR